jgi:hypothetical protein
MKNWILALGALSLAGAACNPIVLEPLKGTQTTDPGPAPKSMLAMRAGDVNWDLNKSPIGPGGSPPWTDPDSLVLFFSTDSQECSDPVLARRCVGAGPFWQAVIAIPSNLAHPGLISLQDPRITVYAAISFIDGAVECSGGGHQGPSFSGTLELISDGSSTLSVKLTDGVQAFGESTVNGVHKGPLILDGEYTGMLCGALPPAAPPAPALAFHGADLPADPGGSAPPDADAVVVFLGTLPDTCQDPWAAADCTSDLRLKFTLPAALQKPGVLSLSDPALAARYTVPASPGSAGCAESSAAPVNGTVEILTSDAAGLTFKVYQSFVDVTATSGFLYFDGLYSAPICP